MAEVAPAVAEPRLFTWYRFESRSTKGTTQTIPFELFYLIPDYHAKEFGRAYEVFLGFRMPPKFLDDLLRRRVSEYHRTGMGRHDSLIKKFERYDKETPRELEKNLTEGAKEDLGSGLALMCVPVLPRRHGDQVSPSYMLNRERVSELTARHGYRENNTSSYAPSPLPIEEMLADMTLYVKGRPMIPCAICTHGIRKLINDKHCSLGTSKCLDKIKLVGVDSFSEKVGRSITPSDYKENYRPEVADGAGV
jgi:hypothetical protein